MSEHQKLQDELNLVAEYASVNLEFEVSPSESKECSLVSIVGALREPFLVDTEWCMGNTKRLPDHTNNHQMIYALRVSHPEVKQVGYKHTPQVEMNKC